MIERYREIIGMPHHKSLKHPSMPPIQRAAQFAPYAALSGFEGEVAETSRLTSKQIELDEYEISRLDGMLQVMAENPELVFRVTYFVPDKRKSGGEYVTCPVSFGKIPETEGVLVCADGRRIPINMIIEIEEMKTGD